MSAFCPLKHVNTLNVNNMSSVFSSPQQSADAGGGGDKENKEPAALGHATSPVQAPGHSAHDGGWTR